MTDGAQETGFLYITNPRPRVQLFTQDAQRRFSFSSNSDRTKVCREEHVVLFEQSQRKTVFSTGGRAEKGASSK